MRSRLGDWSFRGNIIMRLKTDDLTVSRWKVDWAMVDLTCPQPGRGRGRMMCISRSVAEFSCHVHACQKRLATRQARMRLPVDRSKVSTSVHDGRQRKGGDDERAVRVRTKLPRPHHLRLRPPTSALESLTPDSARLDFPSNTRCAPPSDPHSSLAPWRKQRHLLQSTSHPDRLSIRASIPSLSLSSLAL